MFHEVSSPCMSFLEMGLLAHPVSDATTICSSCTSHFLALCCPQDRLPSYSPYDSLQILLLGTPRGFDI